MKVQIEELSGVKRKVQVELPAEMVSEKLEQAYKDVGKNAHLRGFRPGKAPRAILERYFGQHIKDQVSSELIEESFGKIISEHDLRAVGRPAVEEVDLKPGQDMRFTVTVEVSPSIDLRITRDWNFPRRSYKSQMRRSLPALMRSGRCLPSWRMWMRIDPPKKGISFCF